MSQLTFWSEELPANHLALQDCVKDLTIQEATSLLPMWEFLTNLDPSGAFGKMCQVSSVLGGGEILAVSSVRWGKSGMGGPTGCLTLNTLEYPKDADECLLLDVLEIGSLPQKYYLTPIACQGILRRAEKRGKELPILLQTALQHCALEITKESETTKLRGGKLIMTEKLAPTLQTSCNDYSRADGFTMMVYENHPSDSRVKPMGDVCQTVTSSWGTGGGNIPFVQQPIPEYYAHQYCQDRVYSTKGISPALNCSQSHKFRLDMAVRRLTPTECERLQGFPDNYTNIKENCPDGPRYKALGNSMAVPVMRWIGERINQYEQRGMA